MSAVGTLVLLVNARHLVGRPIRSLLAIVGLVAAVTLVVAVGVISQSVTKALSPAQPNIAGRSALEVLPSDATGLPDSAVRRVRQIPGVTGVLPVVRALVTVRGPRGTQRALLIGLPSDEATAFASTRSDAVWLQAGSSNPAGPGLLLSTAVAEKVGASIGGRVDIATPAGRIRVSGAGRAGGPGLAGLGTRSFALMRLKPAQSLLETHDRVDALYVATPARHRQAVIASISRELAGRALVGNAGAGAKLVAQIIKPLDLITSLGSLIALLVAALLVHNTFAMMLADRRREISLMLAVGASRPQVAVAFLFEAAVLGLAASLGGIGLGIVVGRGLVDAFGAPLLAYSIPVVPTLTVTQILVGLATGIGVSLLGAALLIRRMVAARPADALRPEGVYEWRPDPRREPGRRRRVILLTAVAVAAAGSLQLSISAIDNRALDAITFTLLLALTILLIPGLTHVAVSLLRLVTRPLHGAPGRLAFDALKRDSRRTALTAGAVAISTGLIVAIAGASGSYRADARHDVTRSLIAPLYVYPGRGDSGALDPRLSAALAHRVAVAPGVAGVYPERSLLVQVQGSPVILVATPLAEAVHAHLEGLANAAPGGSDLLGALARGEAVMSSFTSQRLHVRPGAEIPLPTPSGPRSLRVGYVWPGGGFFSTVYVAQSVYARLWDDTSANALSVFPDPRTPRNVVAHRVGAAIRHTGALARVLTRGQVVAQALAPVAAVFDLALALELTAAAIAFIVIVITVVLSVTERRWELTMQRVVGMSRIHLVRQLMTEAAIAGYVGGCGGVMFGLPAGYAITKGIAVAFGWNIHYTAPVELSLVLVAAAPLSAALAALPAAGLVLRDRLGQALRVELGGARIRSLVLRSIRSRRLNLSAPMVKADV